MPSPGDRSDDSFSNYDDKSPGHGRVSRHSSNHGRSPNHGEIVIDWCREDIFSNTRKPEDSKTPDGGRFIVRKAAHLTIKRISICQVPCCNIDN